MIGPENEGPTDDAQFILLGKKIRKQDDTNVRIENNLRRRRGGKNVE